MSKFAYKRMGVPMRHCGSVPACLLVLATFGCDYRTMDPTWRSLSERGVSTVPGEYHYASYIRGATDAQFAASVPDLKKVNIRGLNFQNTQLTDRSIDSLLQLRDLERLTLTRTDFTVDGLMRLAALPRLKVVAVPRGQFTQTELQRLRAALPNAVVIESRLGSWRYSSDGNGPASQPVK